MMIDITTKITPGIVKKDPGSVNPALAGHIGTHFDVMEEEFPLDYTRRKGIVFDVSGVSGRDIDVGDICMDAVEKDMFVGFYTGYIEAVGYGGKEYFSSHPQLSKALIEGLLCKGVSIIALDFAGVRRGAEHVPTDRLCAQKGTFVVENLCNLKALVDRGGRFVAHTYPMNFEGYTGLPCRVIAEI